MLDPLLDLVKLKDKMKGGKIGYTSQENPARRLTGTHLAASINGGDRLFKI